MRTENAIAFKEWAVVCAALQQGRQTLILRKGGLHEGREGFRVQHSEFWMFPTAFHQQLDDITRDAWPLLEEVQRDFQPDRIPVRLYAVVEDVLHVMDLSALARLDGQHIWSPSTVEQRFRYRTPGLFALLVRVFARETSFVIEQTPHMAGCKSWVDLPSPLSTDGLRSILSDSEFAQRRTNILAALS